MYSQLEKIAGLNPGVDYADWPQYYEMINECTLKHLKAPKKYTRNECCCISDGALLNT